MQLDVRCAWCSVRFRRASGWDRVRTHTKVAPKGRAVLSVQRAYSDAVHVQNMVAVGGRSRPARWNPFPVPTLEVWGWAECHRWRQRLPRGTERSQAFTGRLRRRTLCEPSRDGSSGGNDRLAANRADRCRQFTLYCGRNGPRGYRMSIPASGQRSHGLRCSTVSQGWSSWQGVL